MFGTMSIKFLTRELNNMKIACAKFIKWIKAHLIATFVQTVTTFRSETNNHLTNIRFAAGSEEAESLNEIYSF